MSHKSRDEWFCAKFVDIFSGRVLYMNFIKDETMRDHYRYKVESRILEKTGIAQRLPGVFLPIINSFVHSCKDEPGNWVINAKVGSRLPRRRVNWSSIAQKNFIAENARNHLYEYFHQAYRCSLQFTPKKSFEILRDTKFVEPNVEMSFRIGEHILGRHYEFHFSPLKCECIIRMRLERCPDEVSFDDESIVVNVSLFRRIELDLPLKIKSLQFECRRDGFVEIKAKLCETLEP